MVYEIIPGFVASTIALVAVSYFGKPAPAKVEQGYDAMLAAGGRA